MVGPIPLIHASDDIDDAYDEYMKEVDSQYLLSDANAEIIFNNNDRTIMDTYPNLKKTMRLLSKYGFYLLNSNAIASAYRLYHKNISMTTSIDKYSPTILYLGRIILGVLSYPKDIARLIEIEDTINRYLDTTESLDKIRAEIQYRGLVN